MITYKSDRDIVKMRRAGKIVADILKLMRDMIRPGIDTLTLDEAAEQLILREGAKPAFKNYKVSWVSVPFQVHCAFLLIMKWFMGYLQGSAYL